MNLLQQCIIFDNYTEANMSFDHLKALAVKNQLIVIVDGQDEISGFPEEILDETVYELGMA